MSLHLRGRVLPNEEMQDVFVARGRITFDQPDDAERVIDDGGAPRESLGRPDLILFGGERV